MTDTPDLAQQLLDAEVEHHLDRLTGGSLEETVREVAGLVLDASDERGLADLVDEQALVDIVTRALATVPGSPAVREILELAGDVLHDGPDEAYPVGELVDRERVAAVLDELLALHPVVERALDRLAESPLVGTVATRFMGRVVNEVVQTNKAVAGKVPGLGSLVSLGSSAASKAMGAANEQVEALIGGTVGKGSAFAVRRLNRIVVDTLKDPTTREAVLEVWDLVAQEPVAGLDHYLTREELGDVLAAGHELVVDTAASPRAAEAAQVVVAAFLERFGDRTPALLLEELELDRDELVEDLVRLAPGVVDALHESGHLERIVRAQLEPFWRSDRVAAVLAGSRARHGRMGA